MATEGSVTRWVKMLNDDEDEAARLLLARYWDRLVEIVAKQLGIRKIWPSDEEDIAQSAMKSFFLGARKGDFPKLDNRGDLHRLLLVITARKIHAHAKRAARKKRGAAKQFEDDDLDRIIGDEPSPEFAVQVAEELELRLKTLGDDQLRKIALMKLDGYTNEEIADKFDVSISTVERRLRLIRKEWSDGDN